MSYILVDCELNEIPVLESEYEESCQIILLHPKRQNQKTEVPVNCA